MSKQLEVIDGAFVLLEESFNEEDSQNFHAIQSSS